MTDRKFAEQREPARAEADRIVTLKTADEVGGYLKDLGAKVARAMLKHWGWYTCRLRHHDGRVEKLFFEVVA